MSLNMQHHRITHLTVMLNKACNLKCDYCFINKESVCGTNDINKELVELVHNGYYPKRLKQLLKEDELQDVISIDIWGGEPTLNTKEIILLMDQMTDICPNIGELRFSSNFALANAGNLVVEMYDELIAMFKRKGLKQGIDVSMQISIDGPPEYTNRNRGFEVAERIKENFALLCNGLKKVHDPVYGKFGAHTHAVIDTESLIMLGASEGAPFRYFNFFWGFEKIMLDSGLHKLPKIAIHLSPGMVYMFPTPETSETGKICAKAMENLYNFYTGEKPSEWTDAFWNCVKWTIPGEMLMGPDIRHIHRRKDGCREGLENLVKQMKTHEIIGEPCAQTYCGATFGSILLAPDEEFALCQNCFFDRYDEYLKPIEGEAKVNYRYIENGNTDYKENSKNWIWRTEEDYIRFSKIVHDAYDNVNNNGYFGNELLARTMIRTMARAGVIDKKYEDPKECAYAAKFIDHNVNCMSILLTITGSIFVPVLYYVPLFLNGALDWIDKIRIAGLEEELKNVRP